MRSRCRTSTPPAPQTSTIDGVEINHQYSKSLEFERDFAEYVERYISPSISYFSFLRPLSEIEIARQVREISGIFSAIFRSCNTAFRQAREARGRHWCCNCPKCRFVFLALVAVRRKAGADRDLRPQSAGRRGAARRLCRIVRLARNTSPSNASAKLPKAPA